MALWFEWGREGRGSGTGTSSFFPFAQCSEHGCLEHRRLDSAPTRPWPLALAPALALALAPIPFPQARNIIIILCRNNYRIIIRL